MAKVVIPALLLLALWSSAAGAVPPDPDSCSVEPADSHNGVVVIPVDPGSGFEGVCWAAQTITVRDSAGSPIVGSEVTIVLDSSIRLCTSHVHHGYTDAYGALELTLKGAGCLSNVPGAAQVIADGVIIRTYSTVKSPDFDGDGKMDVADFLEFRRNFCDLPQGTHCQDLDNDGYVGASDFIYCYGLLAERCFQCALEP